MEEELDKLRNQYFQAILCLQEKEDIENALPLPEYKNFIPLIVGLIQILEQEIDKNIKIRESEKSEEMLEYIEEEITSLKQKRNICNKLLEEATKEIEIEDTDTNNETKNIIFASTNAENIYFEKDLKSIPKDYYKSIETCLKYIEKSIQEDNIEKARAFTNNAKLTGLHEVKDFQIRIIYKILDSNTVYVMQVRIKKDNNSLQDREEIVTRSQQTDQEYKKLKVDIKDEIKKMNLIEEHKKIKERIIKTISSNIGEKSL